MSFPIVFFPFPESGSPGSMKSTNATGWQRSCHNNTACETARDGIPRTGTTGMMGTRDILWERRDSTHEAHESLPPPRPARHALHTSSQGPENLDKNTKKKVPSSYPHNPRPILLYDAQVPSLRCSKPSSDITHPRQPGQTRRDHLAFPVARVLSCQPQNHVRVHQIGERKHQNHPPKNVRPSDYGPGQNQGGKTKGGKS